MRPGDEHDSVDKTLDEVLGYVNLSSGAEDPAFQRNFNTLYGYYEDRPECGQPAWLELYRGLLSRLDTLQQSSPAFAESRQAREVLELVLLAFPPAYRRHHRDLLFHQPDEALFRPFFFTRVFEAALRQGSPWLPAEEALGPLLASVNDFIGHRPVAVLESNQKIQPYIHEWLRPVPLYLAGAGVAAGPYQAIVEQALDVLRNTSAETLRAASFEIESLEELAFDPRAYDFDHPANKRPNYHFGQWDPHRINQQGRYTRFVVTQVTLDSLLARVAEGERRERKNRLREAAVVLAGTILMASGVSGSGPDAHDSTVSLLTLIPRLAAQRDRFYEEQLERIAGRHGEQLRREATRLRQPLGGARQDLNRRLARLRAHQLQHVHLAQIYARMGYPEASARQAEIVPVASARMLCEIHCRLTSAHHAVDRGLLDEAVAELPRMDDLLERGIGCGALADPWNILGFQGQFSLFRALENSVRDHRVDVLLGLMRQIFGLHVRLVSEAAAVGRIELCDHLRQRLETVAQWWDQFASIEVGSVEGVSGHEACLSATSVAATLGAWRDADEAAGDVRFWRQHVDQLQSPKSYALVVGALLNKRDYVSAMALLMQWLSEAEEIDLYEGDYAFHRLALHWMSSVEGLTSPVAASDEPGTAPLAPAEAWNLIRKFFDYLEAGAEPYWDLSRLGNDASGGGAAGNGSRERRGGTAEPSLAGDVDEEPAGADEADDESSSDDLFAAAYEDVTFRDSAADGVQGEMAEWGPTPSSLEQQYEARQIGSRLLLLSTAARLWKMAVTRIVAQRGKVDAEMGAALDEALAGWLPQAHRAKERLLALLDRVHHHPLPAPSGSRESLIEYDHQRQLKHALLEQIIATYVLTSDAGRSIQAALVEDAPSAATAQWECRAVAMFRAVLAGRVDEARREFPLLLDELGRQPLLYVPLARRGDPRKIIAAQELQQVLRDLLRVLPRLGMIGETCRLIETIATMEREHPVGEGAVTEFDRLFQIGHKAIVEALVAADQSAGDEAGEADNANNDNAEANGNDGTALIECLQVVTEPLMRQWLRHSRLLRLSVLEKAGDEKTWEQLVDFIKRYGHDLFTQGFLNLGNLRAILHQGVDRYLAHLEQEPEGDTRTRLIDELAAGLDRQQVVANLELVFEAVVENFGEYKDYNSITTQSDRGELIYSLLDFLRLKANYQRVSWNLKPIYIAHEILVRSNAQAAAELWRRAIAERTSEVADWHEKRLAHLTRTYGMQLPTVLDRIAERFVRPLALDRIRALVRPAVEEARRGAAAASFAILEQEINHFTRNPTGAGFDVPPWLSALENEVSRSGPLEQLVHPPDDDFGQVGRVVLSLAEIQEQIERWDAPPE